MLYPILDLLWRFVVDTKKAGPTPPLEELLWSRDPEADKGPELVADAGLLHANLMARAQAAKDE